MQNKTRTILLFAGLSLLVIAVALTAENKIFCRDAARLAIKGGELSAADAEKLEKKLKLNQNDLSARTQLLGYYFLNAHESDSARKMRQSHIQWIIQNKPDAEIAGLPYSSLDPILDKEVYTKSENLWLSHVKTHKADTKILENAANFFIIYNKDMAEQILKKAQAIEPKNPKWSEQLGHLYSLSGNNNRTQSKKVKATKSLKELENAYSNTPEKQKRFYLLDSLAKAAYEADDLNKAKFYANDLLNLASQYRKDWNYGNAIHHGNLILGRIALKTGDVDNAKKYLIEAGKTPGSPQLNSFGPNMALAKELLENGESDSVLKFLEQCEHFWEMKEDRLKKWRSDIQNKVVPDFGANLSY